MNSLVEQGSPAPRATIARHRQKVLEYVEEFDSPHELVDALAEKQLA